MSLWVLDVFPYVGFCSSPCDEETGQLYMLCPLLLPIVFSPVRRRSWLSRNLLWFNWQRVEGETVSPLICIRNSWMWRVLDLCRLVIHQIGDSMSFVILFQRLWICKLVVDCQDAWSSSLQDLGQKDVKSRTSCAKNVVKVLYAWGIKHRTVTDTLPETNSKSTWKWMVGRFSSFPFFLFRPIFRDYVRFREGISRNKMTSHGNFFRFAIVFVRVRQCFRVWSCVVMSNMSSLSEELQRRGLRGLNSRFGAFDLWTKSNLSNEKKTWLVVWYRGWNPTQLYGDYFISQYKDPY